MPILSPCRTQPFAQSERFVYLLIPHSVTEYPEMSIDPARLCNARRSIAALRLASGPERNGRDEQLGKAYPDRNRSNVVIRGICPQPIAVKTLEGVAHRASYPYALQSYTLDANHLPQSYGPKALAGVSDLPTRTHAPAPELCEVRISAAFPHVTPMVPYAPSAAHVSRFKSSLVN